MRRRPDHIKGLRFLEVAPGVSLFSPERPSFPLGTGLLVMDDVTVVVDTGAGEALAELARAVHVDLVLNTHFHPDHTRGNRYFDAKVACHRLDAPPLRDLKSFKEYTGFDEVEAEAGVDVPAMVDFRTSRVDLELEDGEVLDFGRTKCRVIHTPGHSPGHVALHFLEADFLFLADIDLTSFGPWYGHRCCDVDAFLESMNRVLEVPARALATGHRGALCERERLVAYRDEIYRRDELLLDMIRERPRDPATLAQEEEPFYPAHPFPVLTRYFERVMVEKHLGRLVRLGLAREEDGVFYAS